MYTSFPSLIDEMIADFSRFATSPKLSFGEVFPPFNIFFNENGSVELSFALAGYSKDELSVEIDKNLIIVEGTPKDEESQNEEDSEKRYYRHKIRKDSFKRVYSVPNDTYDIESTSVSYVDGLLTIIVPPKKVEEKLVHKKLSID